MAPVSVVCSLLAIVSHQMKRNYVVSLLLLLLLLVIVKLGGGEKWCYNFTNMQLCAYPPLFFFSLFFCICPFFPSLLYMPSKFRSESSAGSQQFSFFLLPFQLNLHHRFECRATRHGDVCSIACA